MILEYCTISFIANHTSNGTFAVAVTVQDFPKSNISIEGDLYSTESPLSTITLQVGPNAVHSRYRFWKFHC